MPLALEFSKKYKVLGFDISESRIKELSAGIDKTQEADIISLREALSSGAKNSDLGLQFSCLTDDLNAYNVFIVTVPTPIDQFKA
ncbi:MAG: hypothetical protein ACK487_00230, partial [Sphingomonadales bacterium]